MSHKKNKNSELQGITRLITEATIGITDLVQAMHNRVIHPSFLPSTPVQHLITNIAGITYRNIKWSTKFIGKGLDKSLEELAPILQKTKTSKKEEAIRSALNGVIGDYLEKKENPLKISMQFRYQGKTVFLNTKKIESAYPSINGKILLMVHGSCMNDIQWLQNKHNHGELLAKEMSKTPIYLHYNSGLHISTNGQRFSELLEKLVVNWPVKVEELTIIAHSMGGLVTRSALFYGEGQHKKWTQHLKKIVFLGTPHHGAPLEKTGNYLDVILEAIPYTKPFARLAKIRSAGVTDLRYGYLIDNDWQDRDRFEMRKDKKQTIPLPKNIACFSIAASIGKESDSWSTRLIGDRLVDVNSALGKHKNPDKKFLFKKENTFIVYETTHIDLLSNLNIYAKIKQWLSF